MADSDLRAFVDRQEEMGRCWQLVSQEQGGELLLLQGPDGIGKSALLEVIQSRCQAAHYHCARIDFSTRREYASYPNFLSAATDLWCQLNLGTIQELSELVTTLYSASDNGRESKQPVAVAGQMGDVGPGGQAAIGVSIIQVQGQFHQTIRQDDPRVIEPLIRATVTGEVQRRLQALARQQRVVLLLDAWESVLTEQAHLKDPGAWLCDDLLPLMASGEIPNAVALIACAGEPGLGHLERQVHRLLLKPLPLTAVQGYMAERVGLDRDHQTVVQLATLAQGNPLAMKLLADGATRRTQMTAPIPQENSDEEEFAVLGYALDRYLETFPSSVLTAIRSAAIPHRLDSLLLEELGISEKERGEIAQCSFVVWDAERTTPTYHPVARRHLLAWWQENQPAGYSRINRKALDYYVKLAETPETEDRPAYGYEREIAYHKLIEDEAEGISYLLQKFTLAWDLRALGQTQGYVDQLIELGQGPVLAPQSQQWLRYLQARLALLQGRDDWGEGEFGLLADQDTDRLLQALARWSLGTIYVGHNRWTAGVRLYHRALEALQALKISPYAARVLISLGQAYRDLAQASGDFPAGWKKTPNRRERLLHIVQHLPFLAYEALVRRAHRLPNWYFGTNYQDWIVAYLFSEAAKRYRQAEALYRKSGGTAELPEIQLSLAEIDHRLHRQARAKQRYARILASPEVQSAQGSYRRMRALLGRGHLRLEEKEYVAAEIDLQEAREGFGNYADRSGVATANELLGQVYTALQQPERAVDAYAQGMKNYLAMGDTLSATRIEPFLESLKSASGLPESSVQVAEESLAGLKHRQFVLRFSDRLLRWFRRIALIGALPLTYLMAILIGFAVVQIVYFAEGEFLLWVRGLSAGTSPRDILLLIALAILPFFLLVWFYRFVYTVMGFLFVQYLGRQLSPIEEEQPRIITCTEAGIAWERLGPEDQQTVPWGEVHRLASMQFQLAKQPIELISRSILITSSGQTLAIEAITSGYRHLVGYVQRSLQSIQPGLALQRFDFSLLEARSLWSTVGVAVLIGVLYVGLGFANAGYYVVPSADPTVIICPEPPCSESAPGQTVHPLVAPFLFAALPTWILFYAALSLWRLVLHQQHIRRIYRPKHLSIPLWGIILAAILLSLSTLAWVLSRLAPPAEPTATYLFWANNLF